MHRTGILPYLLLSLLLLVFGSCSDNESVEPRINFFAEIKGQWTLKSTQDYLCETDEITNQFENVPDIVREHYDFGEFEVYINGELVKEESGTYEVLEDSYYRFFTPNETYTVKIKVSDDPDVSTMWYDLDQECTEVNGNLKYTYSTWSRTIY